MVDAAQVVVLREVRRRLAQQPQRARPRAGWEVHDADVHALPAAGEAQDRAWGWGRARERALWWARERALWRKEGLRAGSGFGLSGSMRSSGTRPTPRCPGRARAPPPPRLPRLPPPPRPAAARPRDRGAGGLGRPCLRPACLRPPQPRRAAARPCRTARPRRRQSRATAVQSGGLARVSGRSIFSLLGWRFEHCEAYVPLLQQAEVRQRVAQPHRVRV